jgi:hypothetical protein
MTHTHSDFTDTFLALQALACGDASKAKTLDRLLSRCATPDNVSQQLKRKAQIMRLGMHPSQISQVWEILQQSPEKASAMFGGAPLDAIENEIGGEKRKLDALMAAQQLDTELQVLTDTSPCCLSSVLCPPAA